MQLQGTKITTLIGKGVTQGALIGGALLTFLTYSYHATHFPDMLNDGQYFGVWFLTIPVGGVAGSITGTVLHFWRSHFVTIAGWMSLVTGIISLLLTLLVQFSRSASSASNLAENALAIIPFSLFLWSLCHLTGGVILLIRHKNKD